MRSYFSWQKLSYLNALIALWNLIRQTLQVKGFFLLTFYPGGRKRLREVQPREQVRRTVSLGWLLALLNYLLHLLLEAGTIRFRDFSGTIRSAVVGNAA